MRPIAEWFVAADLATAPGDLFFLCDFYKHRPHACGAMGTVAKGLFFRLTAAAPRIITRLDFHNKGMIVYAHRVILTMVKIY